MAEITDTGYELKTQNEWFADELARYLAIDPNWNTDPSTPDGLKIATDSEIFANLDELGLKAYNSKDPTKATKDDLDAIASITGTIRSLGTFSNSSVNLVGVDTTVILAGTLFESVEDGSEWSVDADTVISGVTVCPITAVLRGATQASIGVITKIVNPQSGLESITNPAVAVLGTDPETDAELRARRDDTVSISGNNQVDSTFSAISAIDGVRRVKIYENDSVDPVDSNGLPIHSTAVIVDGGTDSDIAEAIYLKKNAGTIQHSLSNPVTVPVTSPVTGNEKDIIFNRPDYVDILLVYNITDDGSLPIDVEQLIKDATIDYVDGDLLSAESGFNQRGFNIDEDVQSARFYTPANNVIGQYGNSYVTSITVGGGSVVAINFEELARFADSNITVNIT